jgi:hypothetical protein
LYLQYLLLLPLPETPLVLTSATNRPATTKLVHPSMMAINPTVVSQEKHNSIGEVCYATFYSPTSPGEETCNNTLVDNSFHHHESYEELPHIQQPKLEPPSELGDKFTMDLKDESKDVSSSGRRGRSLLRQKNGKDSSSSSS